MLRSASMNDSGNLQRPNGRDGQFEGISIGIAKINRRRVFAESEFLFHRDPVVAEPAAPRVQFARLDAEGDVSRAGGAMSGKNSTEKSDFGAKEEQDRRPGADLKRSAASSFEVGVVDKAQAKDVAIEGDGTIQI